MNELRKIPPVCLFIAIAGLLTGRLKLSKEHVGTEFMDQEGSEYKIFRNILSHTPGSSAETVVFTVIFKFARLSHKANKVASFLPMLLIAGFPGFIQKMYAVNIDNGYWMGMYKWKTKHHLEAYKRSFVFGMMKKRAITDSIRETELKENNHAHHPNTIHFTTTNKCLATKLFDSLQEITEYVHNGVISK